MIGGVLLHTGCPMTSVYLLTKIIKIVILLGNVIGRGGGVEQRMV